MRSVGEFSWQYDAACKRIELLVCPLKMSCDRLLVQRSCASKRDLDIHIDSVAGFDDLHILASGNIVSQGSNFSPGPLGPPADCEVSLSVSRSPARVWLVHSLSSSRRRLDNSRELITPIFPDEVRA